MSKQQKRYQYYGPKGTIMWTNWFNCIFEETPVKRQPNKLRCEYRTI